ncbi:hypothetical protein [Xanthobacter sp. KR7-65]|uniref:hypothetical protein n=1 Tax=Xanthobacter sp. KR7-65 TaxID=3156612 RepID=UPI0032B39D2B
MIADVLEVIHGATAQDQTSVLQLRRGHPSSRQPVEDAFAASVARAGLQAIAKMIATRLPSWRKSISRFHCADPWSSRWPDAINP